MNTSVSTEDDKNWVLDEQNTSPEFPHSSMPPDDQPDTQTIVPEAS